MDGFTNPRLFSQNPFEETREGSGYDEPFQEVYFPDVRTVAVIMNTGNRNNVSRKKVGQKWVTRQNENPESVEK